MPQPEPAFSPDQARPGAAPWWWLALLAGLWLGLALLAGGDAGLAGQRQGGPLALPPGGRLLLKLWAPGWSRAELRLECAPGSDCAGLSLAAWAGGPEVPASGPGRWSPRRPAGQPSRLELSNPGPREVVLTGWRAVNYLAVNSAPPRLALLLGSPERAASGRRQALAGGLALLVLLSPALWLWWRRGRRRGDALFWAAAGPLLGLALVALGLRLAGLSLILAWESLALAGLPALALALWRRPLAACLLGLAGLGGLFLATVLGVGLPPRWFGPPLLQERHVVYMCGLTALAYLPLAWGLYRQRPRWFSPGQHPVAASLLWVFAPCLLLYLANGYSVFGGDTTHNGLLATRLLAGQGLFYDQAWVAEHGGFGLIEVGERFLPTYPMGPGFFGLPTALVQLALGGGPEHLLAAWNQKVTAAWVAALAAALVFQMTWRLGGRALLAGVLTAGFALGSSQLGICSASLWQHGPVVLMLCLGLYCLLRGLEEESPDQGNGHAIQGARAMDGPPGAPAPGRLGKTTLLPSRIAGKAMDGFAGGKWLMLAALPLGLLPALRTQAFVFPLAGLAVVAFSHRRALMGYLMLGLPGAAVFLAINLGLYGSIFGGYAYQAHGANFPTSVWEGLAGTLFSPNRGLLVFSPFLLLALAAWWGGARQRPALAWPWGLALAAYLVMHAKFDGWYAGWCNGARYSAEALPVLVAFLAWRGRHWRGRAWRWLLAGLVGLAILINLPLYLFPAQSFQWNIFPDIDRQVLARVWDWRDWQPLHFRHWLGLSQGRPVPAFALVRNERLTPLPDPDLHYRVGIALEAAPQEVLRISNLPLAAGAHRLILRGRATPGSQATAQVVLDVIYQQGSRQRLPLAAGPAWELAYDFQVGHRGWVDLSLSLAGHGQLELTTAQVQRLGD